LNSVHGFKGELVQKYNVGLYDLFCEAFRLLPLCHVINASVFVVHGGLSWNDGVTLDDIRCLDRVCEPGSEGLMADLLWSDPQPDLGRTPSKRGSGVMFGPDITEAFLGMNDLRFIVRSHQLCQKGYSFEHHDRLITVFSAPNYCDSVGNDGAILRLDGLTLTPRPICFRAVPHPPARAMQYSAPRRARVSL